MDNWLCILAAGCMIASVFVILRNRWQMKSTMKRLEAMVDAAMKGSLSELSFDETRLSRLESMLSHYLAANEMSSKNLASEKDKINTLISDISHQTKTPISNLLLYSELLKEEELPEGAMKSATLIHTQAEKLNFLITSLVKLSRLEAGIIEVNPTKGLLGELLYALYEQYKPAAEEKGLKLIICDRGNLCGVFDKKWTLEAVGNLVDNAIKYTDKGSVTISVNSYELFVSIAVSDTGRGIRESEQGAVFKRFYRSADVSGEKGVGIGLFLSRQIVQAQGGYMKLCSTPGKGTVMSVYLPATSQNLSKL